MRIPLLTAAILLSSYSGIAAQNAPVRLESVARFGCVDCTGPGLFSGIQDIAVAAGRVYIAEATPPFIRIFDTRGNTIRAFARRGDGPGELRLPIHIGMRASGSLEVYDMTQARFTRFDSLGAVLGTRRLNGFVVAAASAPESDVAYIVTTDFRTLDQPIMRLPDDASAPALISTLRSDFPRAEPGHPAQTPALAARPGGGVAAGDGRAEYRILLFDERGSITGEIVRTIPKQRKTPAELDAERDRFRRNAARVAAMRGAEGAAGPGTFTPIELRHHFLIDALEYDEHGRLWVRTERGGLHTTIFDLFDPDGRWLGQVTAPGRLGVFALNDGILAARVTDEDEVQFVGVWRVRPLP